MKYKHTVAFWSKGLILPQDKSDKEIIVIPAIGLRITLTNNPDSYCFEGDRSIAVDGAMWESYWCSSRSGTREERVARILSEIKESRRRLGTGLYFVFEREGNVDEFTPSHEREVEDYVVCFDAPTDEKPILAVSKLQIRAALTALIIAADSVLGFKKISDSIIYFRENGKPVYSPCFSMSSTIYTSHPITTEVVESVEDWYQRVVSDQALERVYQLLISSLANENDTLRSFLSAWAALEIFINKTFSLYEERLFQNLNDGKYLNVERQYLKHVRSVMKGKYPLVAKFVLITSQLCSKSADEDLKEFKKAKEERDKLSHGQDIVEADLPVQLVQNLVRKYLQLYLAA